MDFTQLSNRMVPARLRLMAVLATIVATLIGAAGVAVARRMMISAGPVTTVSAASYDAAAIAPESIVASFGTMLATTTISASDADPNTPGIQLPTSLGGTTVEVNGRRAGLFFVSPTQVNYVIPAETAAGVANVAVRSGDGTLSTGPVQVSAVAPAIFTANSDGRGVPAATLLRVKTNGSQQFEPLARFDALQGRFITRPIDPGPAGERVFLIFYLSGLRRAADPNNDGNLNEMVRLSVGGREIVPTYAGRQPDFVGLDQLNAELPRELIGRGVLDVEVRAAGAAPSNPVQIEMAAAVSDGRAPQVLDDSVNTDEDVARMITLRGNDAASRPLRYIVTRLPRHGRLSGNPPGLTYTPAADYNGSDDFSFLVNNGIEDSREATVTLNIRPVNDPPVLTVGGPRSANAGEKISFIVSAMDVDQGQTLYFTADGLPEGATLNPVTAEFRWTPTFAQSGTYQVSIKVTDNDSPPLSDTKTVNITVDAKWAKTSELERSVVQCLLNDGNRLYAGTLDGGVYRSTNNGQSWASFSEGLSGGGFNVSALIVNGTRLYAGTDEGVYRLKDDGRNWEPVRRGLEGPGLIVSALIVSGSRLYAGTDGGGVYGLDDRSLVWTPVSGLSGRGLYILAMAANPAGLYVGTRGDGVYSLSGDGQSWTPGKNGLLGRGVFVRSLIFNAGGTALFAGTDSGVYSSDDNGKNWVRISDGLPDEAQVQTIYFAGTVLYAGTISQGVYRSTDNGRNWTQARNGLLGAGANVSALAARGTSLFAGTDSGVYSSGNNGQRWGDSSLGLAASLISTMISFEENGQKILYAGTLNRGVYRSTDNGQSWKPVNVGFSEQGLNVRSLAIKGTGLFAGTDGGGVYRLSDDRQRWEAVNEGLSKCGLNVWALAVNGTDLYAGTLPAQDGAVSGVCRSTDNGKNWMEVNNGLSGTGKAVWALAFSGETLYAGTNGGGIYRSTDKGQTWKPVGDGLPADGRVCALTFKGTNLYVGELGRGVYRSIDGGKSWAQVNNGLTGGGLTVWAQTFSGENLYAGTSNGVYRFNGSISNPGWARVSSDLTNPIILSVFSPVLGDAKLFAGTAGDGVFLLADSEQSWTASNTGLSNRMINAVAVSEGNVFAGTLGSGVFHSLDQGQSWRMIPASSGLLPNADIQSIVIEGSRLWAAARGDGIYRSPDNGDSWRLVNEGLTNRSVNELIIVSATLFAATDNGVFRSMDGGGRWELANTGLTSPKVQSLRMVGGRLYAATDDGGVFVSSNSGQNWIPLNTGLTTLKVRSLGAIGTTLFAGTYDSGIFRLDPNGQNWIPVNKGLPDRLTVFSFEATGARVFAGTNSGVFVSTDRGEIWNQINPGLLNTAVISLRVSGRRLIAGTQGGGVFISQIPE